MSIDIDHKLVMDTNGFAKSGASFAKPQCSTGPPSRYVLIVDDVRLNEASGIDSGSIAVISPSR